MKLSASISLDIDCMWFNLLSMLLVVAAEPELKIEPADDGLGVRVVATVPADLAKAQKPAECLTLALVDENGKAGPPILGKYKIHNDQWILTPRYKLAHDQSYRATLSFEKNQSTTRDYQTPKRKPSPRPIVERVYPSSKTLPANHMKFYIYFSKPMREGREIFEQIELLDENGKPVGGAWRRTELWSDDVRRLTLWIHPGRIKTGVNLRDDEGPVLIDGQSYSLVIPTAVRDAEGLPLEKPFIKKFKVGPADHASPVPANWKMTTPSSESKQPLKLEFGEALDHALLSRYLEIHDDRGTRVAGEIQIGPNETTWEFRPNQPWRRAQYKVQIESTLEDLAGNTIARVFDTDLEQLAPSKPQRFLMFHPK